MFVTSSADHLESPYLTSDVTGFGVGVAQLDRLVGQELSFTLRARDPNTEVSACQTLTDGMTASGRIKFPSSSWRTLGSQRTRG